MGLSWGRRPAEHPRLAVRARALLATSVLAATLAGSAGPPSLGRPRSIIEADTRQQIQETLDQQVDAIARRDLFVYERTLDRRDPGFVRCMRELYELGDLRVQELRPYRIVDMNEVAPSLVQLRVAQQRGIATMYMRRLTVVSFLAPPPFDIRRVFFVWYVSPPALAEVGERRTRTVDEVTLTYASLDEPLAQQLLREAVDAWSLALSRAPRTVARHALRVRLAPDRERAAAWASFSCLTAGRYDAVADEVVLYRYWQDGGSGPTERMGRLVRHEVLHWLQHRSVPNMDRVDHWLKEGWPQHILGEAEFDHLVRAQVCRPDGVPPTAAELISGSPIVASGERRLILQAAERSLLAHMYGQGADDATYWRLLAAQSDGVPRDAAYMTVLGRSLERLRADWLARLREDC